MIRWNLKTRAVRPIGLDIGHNSIKMIQLAANGTHLSVLAADKVYIDRGVREDEQRKREFIVSAVRDMYSRGSFRGREVVSCLPSERLKVTSLRVTDAENEDLERVLSKEVSHRFGLDPEQDAMDYMLAGNVRHGDEIKNELILFACDDQTIRGHIRMLEEAQLIPVSIDTVPCALFRSFERSLRRQDDKEYTVVFIDVGNRFTTVVFGRGGDIGFVKQIPIGGERLNREIAVKLGVSVAEAERLRTLHRDQKELEASNSDRHEPGSSAESGERIDPSTRQAIVDAVGAVAEKLAREVSLCFRYYTVTFRGKRVERAVFTGGEAYESILLKVLKRQLSVGIDVARPLSGFDLGLGNPRVNLDGGRSDLFCEWAVAVGLGLKGWSDIPAMAAQVVGDEGN